jgi:hypothetical protein
VVSIIPFIPRNNVFDDAATEAMGEAFDAACKALRSRGEPEVLYEIMARRIVDAARKGERDVQRLREAALKALSKSSRPMNSRVPGPSSFELVGARASTKAGLSPEEHPRRGAAHRGEHREAAGACCARS